MKLILKAQKLSQVVDGTLVRPSTPPTTAGGQVVHTPTTRVGSKAKWDEKDALALTIITFFLENNQVYHGSSFDKTKEAWGELTNLFEAQDAITKMYLRDKLATLKMKENESMTKHIHAF
jgi:hypothetical protein